MLLLTKILLLSSALAAVTSAQAPETQTTPDPCAVLNKATVAGNITYQQVANCYKSIVFNPKDSKATIDTLTQFYSDVFVFRDLALTPNLPSPFSLKPVNSLAELRRIGSKHYRRDYDFHEDLTLFVNSFQDAHVTYAPQCYNSFIFMQPLYLYAPVVNGKQSIRVYKDRTNAGLEDCEVLTINGHSARNAIQAHADKHTGFSKDAGVRFNFALTSHTYWPEAKLWLDTPGMFSLRPRLPETPFIDYVLQCKDRKIRRVRGEWDILPLADPDTFTDRETFVSNLCAHSKNQQKNNNASSKQNGPSSSKAKATVMTDLMAALYLREHGQMPDPSLKDLPDAKQWAGNNTAAYQLRSMPHVGVLVVPTMEQDTKKEIPVIQGYLQQLAKNGVTHIILDMTGNFGGEESFASLLPAIFFKTTDKAVNSQMNRYRVTPAIQKLAEANLQDGKPFTYWDPRVLTDLQFKPFKTTSPFAKDLVNITFNGRSATYSQWVYLDYDLSIVDSSITYPWSNDPSKIVILTDGQCGSACGMTSDHFVHKHGVRAVGVGGHLRKALSMFSFPGASVVSTDEYIDSFESVGLEAPLQRLPYENAVTVGFRYIVSGNDTQPLEYNPKRYPAALRLDYNPDVARHHDKLWAAVAKTAWK
ncbi:hypothetical protein BGZ73_000027 [Actinomortierella ambigua]|nr:hypothetical protein BGZ73_000027 [Actinomortierella ambigua]